MPRGLWIGGVAVLVGVAALAWRVVDTWTPQYTAAWIERTLDARVEQAELAFQPWPTVTGSGLVVGETSIARFEATPALFGLFLGRLQVEALTARGAVLALPTVLGVAPVVQRLRVEDATLVLPTGHRLDGVTLAATTDAGGVSFSLRRGDASGEGRLTASGALSALASLPEVGVLRFAGMAEPQRVIGRLAVERGLASGLLALVGLGGAGAVTGTVDLTMTTEAFNATAIELVAADSRLAGTATWRLADRQLHLALSSANLDLDRLIRPERPGASEFSFALSLEAATVRWQGDLYRRVNLALERAGPTVTLRRVEAVAPGGLELAATGLVDLGAPRLTARIELGADDLRRSLPWLGQSGLVLPEALARDFAAVASLDLTPARAVLAGIDASVGTSRIAGDATLRLADRRLDVVGAIDQLTLPEWPSVPAVMPAWRGAFDVAVTALAVAGVPIERVRLVGSAEDGIVVLDAGSAAIAGKAITAAGTLAGRGVPPNLRLRLAGEPRFELDLVADAQIATLAGTVSHGAQALTLAAMLTPSLAFTLIDDQDGIDVSGTGEPDRVQLALRTPALVGTGTLTNPLAWALGVGGELTVSGILARVCAVPVDLAACLGLQPLPSRWRAEVDLPALTLGDVRFAGARARRAADGRTTLTLTPRAGGVVELGGIDADSVAVVVRGVPLAALADPTVDALRLVGEVEGEGVHPHGGISRLPARVGGLGLGIDLAALADAIAADDQGAMRTALSQGTTVFDRGQVELELGTQVRLTRVIGGGAAGQVRLDVRGDDARLEARPAAAPGRVIELAWRHGSAPADGVLSLDRRPLAR